MAVSSIEAASNSRAYGLDFQSLLQIILQQLTYQDPLKPMDNFQFVSQLAQFSQLQQSQTLNDSISSLINTQSSLQATGLLGKSVDFKTESSSLTGTVKSVALSNGQPSLTVTTTAGETVANIALSSVTQIR